ncbi:Inclusion body protein [Paraburkholderia phenazinium]|uniref:Inclusion body protein n=1 Tax=Paraburkholderia phenazinium TaxID=60549 RepID=A0A1G7Z0K2_9BURK|nr:AidA/PixA family protein [Paraburkholderia phenazinium]SDH02291.1 Inclusion body protein [Paraburkholderia phenazinium]
MTSELDVNFAATTQLINILAVVNTEYVKKMHPNPSKDWRNPTGINNSAVYLLNSTGDSNLRMNVGDTVAFRGTSISDNAKDVVDVYNLRHFSGAAVFSTFAVQVTSVNAVPEDPEVPSGLLLSAQAEATRSFDARVISTGTESVGTSFALYSAQRLYGYFWWNWVATAI